MQERLRRSGAARRLHASSSPRCSRILLWWVAARVRGGAAFGRPREWTPNVGRSGARRARRDPRRVERRSRCSCGGPTTAASTRRSARSACSSAGQYPYGDDKLRGGAAATYGPVFYATHLARARVVPAPEERARRRSAIPERGYQLPPLWPTRVICLAFHLVGLWALYAIGRRLAGTDVGARARRALRRQPVRLRARRSDRVGRAGSPTSRTSRRRRSCSARSPASRWPVVSGALLALGAGTVYYPAFFFPAMLGYYTTARKGAALRFAAGFIVHGPPHRGQRRRVHRDEARQERGPALLREHARSPGVGVAVRDEPVRLLRRASRRSPRSSTSRCSRFPASIRKSPFTKPLFLGLAALSLGGFFLARNRRPAQLALLLAAIAAAVQLWKTQASGTYVEWYYPLLLIGLFADRPSPRSCPRSAARPAPGAPAPSAT